ncbi:NAD(P)H-dependent oxidoreductase [Carnobacteriaceae bacterium zg-ZUI240]|nr:NAD(P)H-dependent oxidoreductase [Carnobacteriaceae bacterium zg-ZUI240]
MKTLVLSAHPTPLQSHSQSFFKETVQSLKEVTYIELVNEQPNVEQLMQYDRIIFQFPVYWYSAPSLLKNWMDETILGDDRRLNGIEFGIVAVFGVSKSHYQAGGKALYTPSEMLRPFEMFANHLGMVYLPPFCVFQFDYMCPKDKQLLLVDYWQYVCGVKNPTFKQRGEFLISALRLFETSPHLIEAIEDKQQEIDELQMIVGDLT